MKKELLNRNTTKVIAALALFSFLFLGVEYLFDNMMMYVTDSKGVVLAQSYMLGISVIGFLLFPVLYKIFRKHWGFFAILGSAVVGSICLFVISEHKTYISMMVAGGILFILLGIVGNGTHYFASNVLKGNRYLALTIGVAYALGILIQFLNHMLVKNQTVETIVFSVVLTLVLVLIIKMDNYFVAIERIDESNIEGLNESGNELPQNEKRCAFPMMAGVMLILNVALMTCVFASLDNAVTLVHATGSVDVGEWPRLLLAVSGILAGVLFDIRNRRYMNLIMYCITLLSTACVVVILFGGPFLVGLLVFYLSAGFFVVYFTTAFIELSYEMQTPQLWAGLGRAINNVGAVITGTVSVAWLESQNEMAIIITALVLFTLISVTSYMYSMQFVSVSGNVEEKEVVVENEEEKFANFSEEYTLTDREQDVLKVLLSSDDSVQGMADELFISRAALYRHIASLNEKTDTKSRIGLIQFYYGWNSSKIAG